MSVLMVLRVSGDPKAIEAFDAKVVQGIAERGKAGGALRHRFFTNGSEIVVVDEWSDRESFQRFFAASPEIGDVMQQAGVTTEPEITFWRKLETNDDIG